MNSHQRRVARRKRLRESRAPYDWDPTEIPKAEQVIVNLIHWMKWKQMLEDFRGRGTS